jgi:hypothetical protein
VSIQTPGRTSHVPPCSPAARLARRTQLVWLWRPLQWSRWCPTQPPRVPPSRSGRAGHPGTVPCLVHQVSRTLQRRMRWTQPRRWKAGGAGWPPPRALGATRGYMGCRYTTEEKQGLLSTGAAGCARDLLGAGLSAGVWASVSVGRRSSSHRELSDTNAYLQRHHLVRW